MPNQKGITVFPYRIKLKESGETEVLPVAEVEFNLKKGESITLFLIIDSGASVSVLPQSDASVFGIVAEQGAPIAISGIEGEPIQGWKHKVRARIGDKAIEIPVIFLGDDSTPRVLGREGVFNRFTIVFEERRKRSAFLAINTTQAQQVEKMIGSS